MKRRASFPRTPSAAAAWAFALLIANFLVWAFLYYLYLCAS